MKELVTTGTAESQVIVAPASSGAAFSPGTAPLSSAVASAIVAQGYGDEPPLLARVLATGFAERLLRALAGQGYLELAAWTRQIGERYAGDRRISAMLEAALPIAQPLLRRSGAAGGDELVTLEHVLSREFERLSQRNRELHAGTPPDVDAVIAGFVEQFRPADPAAAQHSSSVAKWCERIARVLELGDEECTFVARCGLLHDVGKRLTPTDILNAPRQLTHAEWLAMRRHAEEGAALLREIPELRPYAATARWHHERFDGRGYPDRLSGKDIPLHARIVSVADAFNAMIDRRAYRRPLDPKTALETLAANSATQFDPMIVEALIEVVDNS